MMLCVLVTALLIPVKGQCPTEDDLLHEFNSVTQHDNIHTNDGRLCQVYKDQYYEDTHDGPATMGSVMASCGAVYNVCRSVILQSSLTSEECLIGNENTTDTTPSTAQAYGYGFLMILLISLSSLGGVLLVPLVIAKSDVWKCVFDLVYAFMVAMSLSALVTDAVLHLIPHAFGLYSSRYNGMIDKIDVIVKGCVVLGGVYIFSLLEFVLHHFNRSLTKDESNTTSDEDGVSNRVQSLNSSLRSISDQQNDESSLLISRPNARVPNKRHCCSCQRVKPVAWLIILGDSVHNCADGIALGAAISQSLSLGVSMLLALLFHELPHEFGDFVILVKSGFHWVTALLFNFIHSSVAIIGFFIGVAVSSNSESASNWILAITAGLFLYIALTDLLPELVNSDGTLSTCSSDVAKLWWVRFLRFILINIGFYLSFIILLLIALYNKQLNKLV